MKLPVLLLAAALLATPAHAASAPTAAEAEKFMAQARGPPPRPLHQSRPRRLGAGKLHYR